MVVLNYLIGARVKPARAYAFDWFKATNDEERARAVRGCPAHLKEQVNSHIRCWQARQRFNAAQRQYTESELRERRARREGMAGIREVLADCPI